jgi:uncharacterized membrane protein
MRIRLESAKRIGNRIGLNEEKGFAVAIFLALIIVIAVIAGFFTYSTLTAKPVGYNTVYLLDANKKAVDYAEVLVANQNSTFSVYVDVENHMRDTASYQVKVKIAQTLTTFPVDAQPNQTIDMGSIKNDGKPVEKTVTITQNVLGEYSVVFELWQQDKDGTFTFTQNYCVLKIQVIN